MSRYHLMPTHSPSREHISHPLTQRVLSRINLSPDFNYPLIENSRTLAAKLTDPPSPFSAGELSAIGLIEGYLRKCSLSVFNDLDEMLLSRFDTSGFNEIIASFLNSFPTPDVYKDQSVIDNYLFISTGNNSKRHLLYKSIILILIADTNPAIRAGDGLFTSPELRSAPLCKSFLSIIENYFSDQPDRYSFGISLLDFRQRRRG